MRRFGAQAPLSPQGTLPLSSPRLAVLNESFASLAFVKYRGAQIALKEGGEAVLLCSRIFANIQIDRAPKPYYCSILSIYGYYPNVEYRRITILVVK